MKPEDRNEYPPIRGKGDEEDMTGYIGFGNDTLGKMPLVAIGEPIICPLCTQVHKLEGDDNGGDLLMFYRCGNKTYLGAVSRRLVAGIKPDVSGKI